MQSASTTPTDTLRHVPVMLDEVLAGLAIKPQGTYLDGTFGRGGHARAVLARLGPSARLLLLDRDPAAVAAARQAFAADARVTIAQRNFADLASWPPTQDGPDGAALDGVLLDLGVSSPQFDDAARGFSFRADAPLDMRMDPGCGESAAAFLARASETEIADVLWRFGEERASRRIARAIVVRRAQQPLARTLELAELVRSVVKQHEPGRHPATRTFQALRIQVNGELDALAAGLRGAVERLRSKGRLVVISFHSLEDRLVKHFIRAESGVPPVVPRHLPRPPAPPARLRAVGRARFPRAAECARNPRARSAVLRVAERIAERAA